jgi:hypothetical protein
MTWYTATPAPELVECGPATGLSVTGGGDPGGEEYGTAVAALYSVAGPLLALAARAGTPFDMPPLEARWWVEDPRPALEVPRSEWHWHVFLRLPDGTPAEWADQARQLSPHPAAPRVQLTTFTEGPCVQALHEGAYADEPRTLAAMEKYMAEAGLTMNGLHHEIYLTSPQDPDRSKSRTILRHPVRTA